MLYRVTLTGADESVVPSQLMEISKEFPFVEWGILIGSHDGCSRMPSREWIHELCEQRLNMRSEVHLALHVCGKWLREIAAGKSTLDDFLGPKLFCFARYQLNWHGEFWPRSTSENVLNAFCTMSSADFDPEIIFQLDGRNDSLTAGASRRFKVAGLFDQSHGAGVLPVVWPSPRTDCVCGYAGGLGPDNVVEQLKLIQKVAGQFPFWIDMETKLYTDEKFDLEKCRSVLSQCAEFVEAKVSYPREAMTPPTARSVGS